MRPALQRAGAVYFATVGGAGALLSRCIRTCELVAFADAGPEGLFRLEVENFPAVVINDLHGRDYYEEVAKGRGQAVAGHPIALQRPSGDASLRWLKTLRPLSRTRAA